MKYIESTIVYPLPSDSGLERLSSRLRISFPNDYISFLKKYNGVVVENAVFMCDGRERMIERFLNAVDEYAYHPDGDYHIGVVATQLDERLVDDPDTLDTHLLPIASLFAGDMVCLDYRDDARNPTVCVWYHEESGDFDPVICDVADSFQEFLDMLS